MTHHVVLFVVSTLFTKPCYIYTMLGLLRGRFGLLIGVKVMFSVCEFATRCIAKKTVFLIKVHVDSKLNQARKFTSECM